ncbi:MAG: LamG domain-containing protein [Bacteroidota bacterium]|jgi:hypothetical protein
MKKLTMALMILLTIGLYSCKQSNNPVDSGKNPETPIIQPVEQKYSISYSAPLSILASRLNLYYSLAVDSVCITVKNSACDTTGKLTIALSSATGIWNNFKQGSYTVTVNVYATNKLLIVTKSKNVTLNDSITYVSFDVSTPTCIPQNGLVACYQFGGNTNDTSGNGNNGINHGATLTTDRFNSSNSAYQFAGSGYIDLPYNQSLIDNFKDSLTLSTWVYFASWPALSNCFIVATSNQNIYALQVQTYNSQNGQNGLFVVAQINSASGHTEAWSNSLQLGNWYHIVMTYNRQKLSLFINGIFYSSINCIEQLYTNQASHLWIGVNYSNSAMRNYFDVCGKIDDIRFYSRALNSTEIKFLYHENGWGY